MAKRHVNAETQLVVVGASAGGIEALSVLVSTLPADFAAPLVIAQHLDPRRESNLQEILAHRSALPVHTVRDREPLMPGVVYVVPSNRLVDITNNDVHVAADGPGRPKPSVDLLLRTAADAFGERLIAVILTGTGSDGTAGARAVKEAGGTVVVQNPSTARFPAMPESLAPTTVDIVADLEAIGPLLHDLVRGAYLPSQPREDRLIESLLDRLRERNGINFSAYRRPTILRRLQRRMVAVGSTGLRDYIRYLDTHPEEYQRLTSSFLIKVTEFFRDPELFAVLRQQIIPGLVEDARQHGQELRFWSAGCATGEEAYSLALLLADLLGDELDRFNIRIFATDVDEAAVAFARRGRYPAAALSAVSPALLNRCFTDLGSGEYEVKKFVRSLLIFGQHDLGQRAPFPRIDLALCRNVLIYFTPELQRRCLELFAFALRNGGILALGKSETTHPLPDYFTLVDPRLKIFRRYGEPVLIPPTQFRSSAPAQLVPRPHPGPDIALGAAPDVLPRAVGPRDRAERTLFELPVGVVVLDRKYDILQINGAARRLLGIYHAATGEDFLHLVQNVPLVPLREALDAAFRGETVQIDDIPMADPTHVGEGFLRVQCGPAGTKPGDTLDHVVVLVLDTIAEVRRRQELERERDQLRDELAQARGQHDGESERLSTKITLLAATNRQLLDANQELTRANVELASARDAYLLSSEEAQAAIEEVETLNEEVQASNEELETLNEELQATVEELNTTNDDLEARSAELEELARHLEGERARLTTILGSLGDAVLVVDGNGTPLRTNDAYAALFEDADRAPAPADAEGRPLPEDATPRRRAARGEAFRMDFTLPAADGTRRWFEAVGQPIRAEGEEQGVVVIREITDRSVRRLQDELLASVSHELRTPLTSLRIRLQMLERRLRGPNNREDALRQATEALGQIQRLTELANELLDASRISGGKLDLRREPLELGALVAAVVETMQPPGQAPVLRLEAASEPLPVHGDVRRLEQVLFNLIGNAIQYAPGTAVIDVRLRRTDGEAELEVQDYGPGIPDAEQANIFSRYYQAAGHPGHAHHGLGLGLYICREIVLAHGGRIAVRSAEGQGTTFSVRLPLA